MTTISAIVPATDAPATLERCLEAIRSSSDAPDEVIVVDEPSFAVPAIARNVGADRATGDVLVFVDADIVVHPDVFQQIRRAFADDETLAALFGSYDDAPSAADVVSRFRNLLHHHVHQSSPGPATTFWAGIGAVRRETFDEIGGFDNDWDNDWKTRFGRPSVEDIELGMRLHAAGKRIELQPGIQGTHLKSWSLKQTVTTDLFGRGVPWVVLLLRAGTPSSALNLGWRHRMSALSSLALVGSLLLQRPKLAGSAAVSLVALNHSFYQLLLRRQGVAGAAAGVPLHVLHHLTAVASVPIGIAVHLSGNGEAPTRKERTLAGVAR
jgi:GT2 family glycosyltransferase